MGRRVMLLKMLTSQLHCYHRSPSLITKYTSLRGVIPYFSVNRACTTKYETAKLYGNISDEITSSEAVKKDVEDKKILAKKAVEENGDEEIMVRKALKEDGDQDIMVRRALEEDGDQEIMVRRSLEEDGDQEIMVRRALEEDDFDLLASLVRPSPSDIGRVAADIPQSFTLAPYVNEHRGLQALVALGVQLFKLDKIRGVSKYILSLDFEADMKPYIQFLHDKGVPGDMLGRFVTRTPLIFRERLGDLQVLSMTTEEIDASLGYYQRSFKLSGNEIRYVITKNPKLVTQHVEKLKLYQFSIRDEFGFSEDEMKAMLLEAPKIFLLDRLDLREKFHYLHNIMGLSHETLVSQPVIFYTRLYIVKQRHEFLNAVHRAQYDPTKENYVSLKALVSLENDKFCENVAKLPPHTFKDFLKTL